MSNTNNNNQRIFLSPPFVGERERAAVMAAFDSGYIAPCGPQVDEFERMLAALSGRRYAVALSSGTAAIDLFLEYLGVGKGWTVFAPTLSFIATVGPAWHRGARLVLIDSDASGNIDPAMLEKALSADTTANRRLVIGVDLYGRCCDYDALAAICQRYQAEFFLDSAESVGSTRNGRGSGSSGLAAVYSFNGNKTVTTSGGGALLTDSDDLAASARKISTQSREPVLHYEHRSVGYNYRLSNILAAIGIAQLSRLPELLALRRRNADFYAQHLPDTLKLLPPVEGSNNWLNVALCPDEAFRDRLIAALDAEGIESRPVWKPMHLQPVFAGVECFGGAVAEALFRCGICLPSGSSLSETDLARIVGVCRGVSV